MGIFWVPKDAQKTGCKSAGWPSYLFGADMGSSSTRDGFGRATLGRQNNVSCESDRRRHCFAILKSEKN